MPAGRRYSGIPGVVLGIGLIVVSSYGGVLSWTHALSGNGPKTSGVAPGWATEAVRAGLAAARSSAPSTATVAVPALKALLYLRIDQPATAVAMSWSTCFVAWSRPLYSAPISTWMYWLPTWMNTASWPVFTLSMWMSAGYEPIAASLSKLSGFSRRPSVSAETMRTAWCHLTAAATGIRSQSPVNATVPDWLGVVTTTGADVDALVTGAEVRGLVALPEPQAEPPEPQAPRRSDRRPRPAVHWRSVAGGVLPEAEGMSPSSRTDSGLPMTFPATARSIPRTGWTCTRQARLARLSEVVCIRSSSRVSGPDIVNDLDPGSRRRQVGHQDHGMQTGIAAEAVWEKLRGTRWNPPAAARGQPVGCQKSAWPVSCSDAPGSAAGMMISHVPPSALSDLHPGLLAGPARPLIGVEERGTAGAAA